MGRAALNKLRKFDTAGRIMETNEGVAALRQCGECKKKSMECKAYGNGEKGKACAYCTRMGRPGCKAMAPPSPPTMEQRVEQLAAELETVKAELAAVKAASVTQAWSAWAEREITSLSDAAVKWREWFAKHPW